MVDQSLSSEQRDTSSKQYVPSGNLSLRVTNVTIDKKQDGTLPDISKYLIDLKDAMN